MCLKQELTVHLVKTIVHSHFALSVHQTWILVFCGHFPLQLNVDCSRWDFPQRENIGHLVPDLTPPCYVHVVQQCSRLDVGCSVLSSAFIKVSGCRALCVVARFSSEGFVSKTNDHLELVLTSHTTYSCSQTYKPSHDGTKNTLPVRVGISHKQAPLGQDKSNQSAVAIEMHDIRAEGRRGISISTYFRSCMEAEKLTSGDGSRRGCEPRRLVNTEK